MSFVFENLLGATLTLTILYLILFVYVGKRLLWVQTHCSSVGMNTRKLFVMTCLLTAGLRLMSFGSMTMLNLGRVHFRVETSQDIFSQDDDSDRADFFQKACIVLFDFPDFCCISAYVLLIVIWAESYLKSRRHWFSPMRFRRAWMFGYFLFNILLYSSQLALYSLLFIPSVTNFVQMKMIYFTLSAFNLVLPILWLIMYIYLAIVVSLLWYTIINRI